jgi:N-acetylmuramoyl-L-alanine amidase
MSNFEPTIKEAHRWALEYQATGSKEVLNHWLYATNKLYEMIQKPDLKIITPSLKFTKPFTTRTKTEAIILHHRGGTGDIESIHLDHIKRNGWIGIGYNLYIRLNGSVYLGRPLHVVGAHTLGWNDKSIGICCEGNYEILKEMPKLQEKSLIEAIKLIKSHTEYANLRIMAHRDVYATACPGKYFPMSRFINL